MVFTKPLRMSLSSLFNQRRGNWEKALDLEFRTLPLFWQIETIRDQSVVSGGGNQSFRREPPPNPKSLAPSHMRPPWLEQRQWWETVSSQWQRHNLDHSTIRVGPYKAIEQRQVICIFLTCLQSRNLNPRSSRLVSNRFSWNIGSSI